jgi:4-hydroxy-tetrahydrodipicolinate synthase
MNSDFVKGVVVPILTPIDKSEKIDEAAMRRMVNYVIRGGVDGLLLYGSNGEFFAIDDDEEFKRGIDIALSEIKGRVPLYIGIGSITTRKCIIRAEMAAEKSVQGISLLQPMFLSPCDDNLYDHFAAIAGSVRDLPVLLYNNPRAGYGISPALITRLNRDIDNIVGVKDSSGNMNILTEYVRLTEGTGFKVLAGKDTLIFASLAQGAVGCVATTANFVPALVADIYRRYMAGDIDGARKAQFRLTPIRLAMDLADFPVGTKDMANLMGLNVGTPYLPNKSTTGSKLEQMRTVLKESGLL